MTTIERLRVRNGLDDALVTRLRLERLLAAVQVRVFSPSALVVIRHMPDPLPGAIDLRRDWLRPPLAWEQAFTAQVERYLHAAARPSIEAVPANAPAVWFADASEYLACLSTDWVRDELSTHWWWRSLLRSAPHAVVESAWSAQHSAVPMTLHALAERDVHLAVLNRLSPAALATITRQVERVYELAAVSDQPLPSPNLLTVTARRVAAIVPEANQRALAPTVYRLLVIGLLLARRPAEAHALLGAWFDEASTESSSLADKPTATKAAAPPSLRIDSAPMPISAANSADADTEALILPAEQSLATSRPLTSAPAYAALTTQYGGVFFLLNVALALRLYGDFTEPDFVGLALSPWDWLSHTTKRLLGVAWHGDQLSAALTDLTGRTDDEIAETYATPPRDWHIPPPWLDSFPEGGDCRVLITGKRLQVQHPVGFVLADVPLSGDAHHQAAELLKPFGLPYMMAKRDDEPSPFAADPLTWETWFDLFIPYLRARLDRAVDLPPSAYLELPARVFITATQVDVVFALADLPLAVRLAGLDRDIGWLPAAGRSIRFQFE